MLSELLAYLVWVYGDSKQLLVSPRNVRLALAAHLRHVLLFICFALIPVLSQRCRVGGVCVCGDIRDYRVHYILNQVSGEQAGKRH